MRRGLVAEFRRRPRVYGSAIAASLLFIFWFSSTMPSSPYGIVSEGKAGTNAYQVYVTNGVTGARISAWHDVSLMPRVEASGTGDGSSGKSGRGHVVNFVCEIPRGTTAKFETDTKTAGNPIVQDTHDDGTLRYYSYGKTFFNYGGIPQTWEDPFVTDETGAMGDNDPLDVMEIGDGALATGAVAQLKVLGAIPMIDQDELDWKILGVTTNSPSAAQWDDLDDVPANILDNLNDWLINYKTTDGKPKNVLGKPIGADAAMEIIRETHVQWRNLRLGVTPARKLWTGVSAHATRVPAVTLLAAVTQAAEQAGDAIAAVHKAKALGTISKGSTDEGVMDPLTLADMTSHILIKDIVSDLWPSMAMVSEEDKTDGESTTTPSGVELPEQQPIDLRAWDELDPDYETAFPLDELTVWIDPLDATKEYTEDLLQYVTVMINVVHKTRPVISVIHQVFADDANPDGADVTSSEARAPRTVWVADFKEGPTLGGVPSAPKILDASLSKPRIVVSRSHPGALVTPIKALHGTKVSAGGAGFKALTVMDGYADLYLHRTAIKLWDIAAPDGLFTILGGSFSSWDKSIFGYPPDADVKTYGGVLGAFGPVDGYAEALAHLTPSDPSSD